MPVECICQECGATFMVPPWRIERGWGHFCSMKCLGASNAKRLQGNTHAKGHKPNSTSFKPGLIPWNKGLTGIHLSPETEFRPGDKNIHDAPIGTVTIRKDKNGALRRFIKLEAYPVPWVEFARVVWSNHHGLIPDGMVVHHRDRDTLNDEIENLELLGRGEHLAEHRAEIRAIQQEHS